jgi:hypothetical protein
VAQDWSAVAAAGAMGILHGQIQRGAGVKRVWLQASEQFCARASGEKH